MREKTRREYDHIRIEHVIKVMDKKNTGFVTRDKFNELFDILYVLRELEKRKDDLKKQMKEIPMWRQRVYMIYQHKFYD